MKECYQTAVYNVMIQNLFKQTVMKTSALINWFQIKVFGIYYTVFFHYCLSDDNYTVLRSFLCHSTDVRINLTCKHSNDNYLLHRGSSMLEQPKKKY